MKNLTATLFACVAVSLGACSTHSVKKEAAPAPETASEANLLRTEASARSSQVQDVSYGLQLTVDAQNESFKGAVTTTFRLTEVPNSLFLDFKDGGKIESYVINGKDVAPTYANHRIEVPGANLIVGVNKLTVSYTQNYSHNGRGLHRFQDPEDQRVYLYTQFEEYDAHQMVPCFDQPDMKATWTLSVTAPKDWMLISTTRETSVSRQGSVAVWNFPETPRMSTYLFSLHAGPYHKWETKAGDIPLRLFARQSLAKYVNTPDWFTPTRQGLKFYGSYFGYPYPFKKYDQVIAPDFNAGAMENIAAVTFSENFIHRGVETREDREGIASVLLHEMAHMWFGDLVTMKWWNGLWLNESFATFMSALSMHEATDYKESWQSFYTHEKSWAYTEDQLITTHPIENANINDTNAAKTNFDGITYGKGASVLKQLNYYLGENTFRDGVRHYFKTFAYQNTELKDFTGSLEFASGKKLLDWSNAWLMQEGVDSVQADYSCVEGKIAKFSLRLLGPNGIASPRPHRTQVALYQQKDGHLVSYKTTSIEYAGPSTVVNDLTGAQCPAMVYPNDADYDYVKVQFDVASLEALRTSLPSVSSAFTRQLIVADLFQMVRDAILAPQDYLAIAEKVLRDEPELKTAQQIIRTLETAFYYLPLAGEQTRGVWAQKFEHVVWNRLQTGAAESDWRRQMYRAYVSIVETPEGRDHLLSLLNGETQFKGLVLDTDRKWLAITRLAALGDERVRPFLQTQRDADHSERGIQSALQADAAWPVLTVKQDWFNKAMNPKTDISYARQRTVLRDILPGWQDTFRSNLASDFYKTLPTIIQSKESEFLELYTRAFLPSVCTLESAEKIKSFYTANASVFPPTVMKPLKIGSQEDTRCANVRAKAAQSDKTKTEL